MVNVLCCCFYVLVVFVDCFGYGECVLFGGSGFIVVGFFVLNDCVGVFFFIGFEGSDYFIVFVYNFDFDFVGFVI